MRYSIFTYEKHKKSPVFKILNERCQKEGYVEDNDNPELVFFVGGDGTFFRAVQFFQNKLDTIRFIGINIGNLGFFYDYDGNDIDTIFEILKKDDFQLNYLKVLEAKAKYEDGIDTYLAINEVRIENPFHTLISDVLINDKPFETFRGNGLVVSSPLGSTAYNKSLGGAVISPDVDALEITEIASISNNKFRSLGSSLVIPGDSKITFKGDFSNVVIGFDFETIKREGLEELHITTSKKKVSMICSKNHNYVEKLKKSFMI